MDKDFALLLTGAGIALVSTVLTALIQHYLSLRTDQIKREREARENRIGELRDTLQRGLRTRQQLRVALLPDDKVEWVAKYIVAYIEEQAVTKKSPTCEE